MSPDYNNIRLILRNLSENPLTKKIDIKNTKKRSLRKQTQKNNFFEKAMCFQISNLKNVYEKIYYKEFIKLVRILIC